MPDFADFVGCQADVNNFIASMMQPTPSQLVFSYLEPALQHALPVAYGLLKISKDGGCEPDWVAVRESLQGKGPEEQQAIVIAQLQVYFHTVQSRALQRSFNALFPPEPVVTTPASGSTSDGHLAIGIGATATDGASEAASPVSNAQLLSSATSTGSAAEAATQIRASLGPTNAGHGRRKTRSSAQRACTRVILPDAAAPEGASSAVPPSVLRSIANRPALAAMSSGARANVAANEDWRSAGGDPPQWRYSGVFRWAKGAVDGAALTLAEIESEQETSGERQGKTVSKVERLRHLRERWVCNGCGVLRYERVGRTANLSKHRH
ncbi:hypothetical protein OC842_006717 [Tilletia horrida]|uniref:Uncharacterized protein n=1 Tax=Tilletia horrida TaxID=155126 RepID=A0AAN6G7C6_9BASI|nr:hypothetical protein OC842_006717 [Tilletia horrida]KAK0553257.1 hypothetical protein OC844_006322 [Tilletia horrida]